MEDTQNCGIYCWTNKVNGKKYVGQANDLERRKKEFLRFDSIYTSKNSRVDNCRNKYNSSEYWDYEILELCPQKDLNNRETYYIIKNRTRENGLNLTLGGTSESLFGRKIHRDIVKKMSDAHKKPIYQIDLEGNIIKEWDSATDAENYYNTSSITACCNGRCKTVKGFRWIFKDERIRKTYVEKSIEKPIVQLSLDGKLIKEWESAIKASKELNLNVTGIYFCCRNEQASAHNYIWMLKDNYDPNENYNIRKKIYQINSINGEIIKEWNNQTEASKELNIRFQDISKVCNRERNFAGGFVFRFKCDYDPNENYKKFSRNQKILQYDLDYKLIKEWKGLSEIQNELGYKRETISYHCKRELTDNYKGYNGYIWRYKK